jgi:adenylyltransferase/sulfurtransferase
MPQEITPHELAAKLAADEAVYLLDVRLPWEHEAAALPGSVLIPVQELPQRRGEVRPPPGATVVAYCHHGVRSWGAAQFLEMLGLPNVLSLAGGIDAWSREVDPRVPRY